MKHTKKIVIFWGLTLLLGNPAVRAHPEIDWQIAEVTARIADHPGDTALLLQRGELHRIHRDWPSAVADFKLARELEPGLAIVDFHLGRLSLEAGRPAEAVAALDHFIAGDPQHSVALLTRARARAALGRFLEAASDFTSGLAVSARPEPNDYLDRARALAAAGNAHLAEALSGLDEGLARLGRPVTLELEAIELDLRRGSVDAALARLDRIVASSARKEAWLIRRGEILEQSGRGPQAQQAYARALEAIDTLPASRRSNRAVQRLETEARNALERLSAAP